LPTLNFLNKTNSYTVLIWSALSLINIVYLKNPLDFEEKIIEVLELVLPMRYL